MKRGFYIIMAAQFFSALADSALLIAAIALLNQIAAPTWMQPLLALFFVISYVALAPFVGPFADAIPKGKVMLVTNGIKILGCCLMLFYEPASAVGIAPWLVILLAYGIVGFGAAAYSPAKYGILTELLPAEKLVAANAWIEALTVTSIIIGTVLGGVLIKPVVAAHLLQVEMPNINLGIDSPAEAAITIILACYVTAAIFNFFIPDTGARYEKQETRPVRLLIDFSRCFVILWKDRLGQISLGITTLFWGAGATLRLILLEWARVQLGMPLDDAARLPGVFALGIAMGAVLAARVIPLKKSLRVLPIGIAMGLAVTLLGWLTYVPLVYALLFAIGAMAGFFVVPLNALLQHRGHVLLSAGHSIAVQNFNENLSILVMLLVYSTMLSMSMYIHITVVLFGLFVAISTAAVGLWHRHNQRRYGDLEHTIGTSKSDASHH